MDKIVRIDASGLVLVKSDFEPWSSSNDSFDDDDSADEE
jgi:hypothetical protein